MSVNEQFWPKTYHENDGLTRYGGRDLLGYGDHPPCPKWPTPKIAAKVALNFCLHYQEGGEACVLHGNNKSDSSDTNVDTLRDLNAESVYEYGARAGFWRYHRLFAKKKKVPITLMASGMALERNPAVCQALKEAVSSTSVAWEVATQGYRLASNSKDGDDDDEYQQEDLQRAIHVQEKLIGKRPVGFYSGSPSLKTRQHVVNDGGFKYDSDSYSDDLPYWTLDYGSRPHLVVPYTLTENDDKYHGDDFFKLLKDTLRFLVDEGRAGQPKLMNVALHCRWAHPARVAAISDFIDYAKSFGREVWICTREDVADYWILNHSPRGAGSPVKIAESNGVTIIEEITTTTPTEEGDKTTAATSNGELKEANGEKTNGESTGVEGDVI